MAILTWKRVKNVKQGLKRNGAEAWRG
jgi:hypothetical protein